jgi:hypothetical protein
MILSIGLGVSDYLRVTVTWVAALYLAVNAVYALRSPAGFLKSRWTIKRGFSARTSTADVMGLGGVLAVMASFLTWFSCLLTFRTVRASGFTVPRSARTADYLVLAAWWLGTLFCLCKGVYALVSPSGWMSSRWGAARMAGLTSPRLVRVIGLVFTLVGLYWAIMAVRMALRLLGG